MFSGECPEYDIELPGGGQRLVILPNHFKSKRNGEMPEPEPNCAHLPPLLPGVPATRYEGGWRSPTVSAKWSIQTEPAA